MPEFQTVGKSVEKIDSMALATGAEKFTADFQVKDTLHIAMLYSPHAFAEIEEIDTTEAEKCEGVVLILHHGNSPKVYYTTAGQGYPEPSPYDNLLFDKKVRFVGDNVALVAAETLSAAKEATKKIKVKYKVLTPLFDPEKAMDADAPILHSDGEHMLIGAKYEPEKNLAAEVEIGFGDVEAGMKEGEFVEEHTYHTHCASHCATEPHAAVAYYDERGRLTIVTTTQVPFHARRIVARQLSIPLGKIRVIKPRIGGGFGGKQEVLLEPYVALVAERTKRAAKFVMSRQEVFISSRTRNPMRTKLTTAFKKDGEITALSMDCLMNTGAYGSHALTVLSNGGSKVLPLFNKIKNMKFFGRSVYTNLPVGGAYRGYGATQTYFALCQHIDMIARKTGQDPLEYIKKWHIREGETSEVFKALGEGKEGVEQIIKSCKLDECIDLGAKEIGWSEKRGKKLKNGDRVKGIGFSVSMQGSGIPMVDMAAASMKMNEDGSFNLFVGATDLGTGSDTILAQMAAEVLGVETGKIIVRSSDTDITPFDVGAYASSTTYVSGQAVIECAEKIRAQIFSVAAGLLNCGADELVLKNGEVINAKTGKKSTLAYVATYATYMNNQFQIQAEASFVPQESPPPFIAQFAEADVDVKTGRVHVVKFVSAIDCGQPINPILVEGQVEGAVVNGMSFALCENYDFDATGRMTNPSFWDYKVFTTADLPEMKTIIVNSYEETGPFGAKSAGEIAINGPLPAIANAIFDAVGVRMFDAPFTPEKVLGKIKGV